METLPVSEIRRITAEHGAVEVMIFGSRARGDASPHSDLDLLIDVRPGTSLFDLIRMEEALGELLELEVEILTLGALNPWLRKTILGEARPLDAA